jgi:hypothetical protein
VGDRQYALRITRAGENAASDILVAANHPTEDGKETRMKFRSLVLVLLAAVLLAACGSGGEIQPQVSPTSQPEISTAQPEIKPLPAAGKSEDLARWDSQGAVEVEIRPRNLLSPIGGLLEFDVFMNTHSVDLSMDLAALSTLETDLGLHVSAGWWSGGSGHHVQGVLTFPERDPAGRMILEGARTITLRIEGVDAPVRLFEWETSPES